MNLSLIFSSVLPLILVIIDLLLDYLYGLCLNQLITNQQLLSHSMLILMMLILNFFTLAFSFLDIIIYLYFMLSIIIKSI